jgi:chromosome condensin MukBEF MukE localization factor
MIKDKKDKGKVKISKAVKLGNSVYIALTGIVEEGKHYSIKKVDNKIILEDIEEFLMS